MKKKLRIAWAGGGTGGHTFPIQSLLQYFGSHPDYAQQVEAHYWFGKEQSLEQAVYLKLQTEIQNLIFLPLLSGKWRREKTISALLRNFWDLVLFMVGVFQALWYLWKYQIDVIFCKGGYVALPVVVAGWILRKKIIVHESDTHPGLVNRIAGKVATQNFSWFPKVLPQTRVVGQILSDGLLGVMSEQREWATQVLVMWGSQGAKSIYEALAQILQKHKGLQEMRFVLILGQLNQNLGQLFDWFENVEVRNFCSQEELGQLYRDSDVVITRAGTTSLAEQELFDLQMIMIPIPWTHDQLSNAERYVREKGKILIQQDDPAFLERLGEILLRLRGFRKELSQRDLAQEIAMAKEEIIQALLKF